MKNCFSKTASVTLSRARRRGKLTSALQTPRRTEPRGLSSRRLTDDNWLLHKRLGLISRRLVVVLLRVGGGRRVGRHVGRLHSGLTICSSTCLTSCHVEAVHAVAVRLLLRIVRLLLVHLLRLNLRRVLYPFDICSKSDLLSKVKGTSRDAERTIRRKQACSSDEHMSAWDETACREDKPSSLSFRPRCQCSFSSVRTVTINQMIS